MTDISQCPHCYTRVVPMSDGTCPSCRKNTNDVRGVDPSKTRISIANQTALPPICHQCGVPTDRYVSVSATSGGNEPSRLAQFLSFLIAVSLLGLFLFERDANRGFRRKRDKIRVRLPQCDSCATQGKPVPAGIDTENYRMSFVVDRKFAEALDEPRH